MIGNISPDLDPSFDRAVDRVRVDVLGQLHPNHLPLSGFGRNGGGRKDLRMRGLDPGDRKISLAIAVQGEKTRVAVSARAW